MQLEKGKRYFGFKLIEEKEIKDINSVTRSFIHEKSGAKTQINAQALKSMYQ